MGVQTATALGSLLVVDDDPDVREGLCEFLSDEGYAVRSARDGADALRQLKQVAPDLVLLDLRMPGMDGYEFLQRREAEVALRQIPVVVVSATAEERKIDFSGVCTLRKPVKVGVLLDIIHNEMLKRLVH